ncbi:MAG: DnaJ domain-containing protein [Nitrosopumilaceae archaeon]|nr:DnaJ domain-containing protein [Nitrosopumilaceae archaeon]NIU00621.1 DnaJ domain-containing protein [Nitrosopumilaceae archaeon]NIU87007.1 DnaJ domain-containing protein [Nitrosopumilaceae archaeon]NIV66471.1 DnaJ domain-containing protein [Nitrosopumilaceae archaeon]NIX61223.1 DnaJ domain-containing protein [Nitrosopumilaceae archaeon]
MDTLQALRTLDVNQDASFEEIKVAYRQLALNVHPDRNTTEHEGKRFKQITEAYQILRDAYRKDSQRLSSNSKWSYTDRKTHQKTTFRQKKPRWGAPPKDHPPEENWSKFTKGFEEEFSDFWKEYEKKFWQEYESNINAGNNDAGWEKTRESKDQPDLFVDVDKSLCIGCCSCETIAPEVFNVDKLTKMNPKSKVVNAKGAGKNKIMNAAETCPTKAIIVEDKDKKERLYPL